MSRTYHGPQKQNQIRDAHELRNHRLARTVAGLGVAAAVAGGIAGWNADSAPNRPDSVRATVVFGGDQDSTFETALDTEFHAASVINQRLEGFGSDTQDLSQQLKEANGGKVTVQPGTSVTITIPRTEQTDALEQQQIQNPDTLQREGSIYISEIPAQNS